MGQAEAAVAAAVRGPGVGDLRPRLLRVEELAPGIFRGMLAGGAQALAVVREDGRIAVREAEPWA